jgi:hypothetical protein
MPTGPWDNSSSARATRRRTSRAILVATGALGGVACAMGVSIPRGLAALIFRRHRKAGGRATFTDLSDAISVEINTHYAKLFGYFQARPELSRQPLYRRPLIAHLPRMIRDSRPSGCGSRACRPSIARPCWPSRSRRRSSTGADSRGTSKKICRITWPGCSRDRHAYPARCRTRSFHSTHFHFRSSGPGPLAIVGVTCPLDGDRQSRGGPRKPWAPSVPRPSRRCGIGGHTHPLPWLGNLRQPG